MKNIDMVSCRASYKGNHVSSAENLAACDACVTSAVSCGCDPDESCAHRRGAELERMAIRYYDRLVRFLKRRSHSMEDAADLAQDTFARLSSTDFRQINKPESFLFTTALNLLRDHARSAQTRYAALTVSVEDTQLVCPAPQAERVLDGELRMRVVEAALRELSPKCRAVFVLFHFDGLSQRDIADRLHISVSMVEKYVKQAVNHCEKRLAELNVETANSGGCAP
jgi:RNA polymerase sigma factor (sigma-70 family)